MMYSAPKFRAYDGSEYSASTVWLKKVKRLAKAENWNEEDYVPRALTYLSGRAEIWAESYLAKLDGVPNWAEFQRAFKVRFFPKPKVLTALLRNRKQAAYETVDDYYDALVTLHENQRMTGSEMSRAELLDVFVMGLRPEYADHVGRNDPATLDEALEMARRCESWHLRKGQPTSHGQSHIKK